MLSRWWWDYRTAPSVPGSVGLLVVFESRRTWQHDRARRETCCSRLQSANTVVGSLFCILRKCSVLFAPMFFWQSLLIVLRPLPLANSGVMWGPRTDAARDTFCVVSKHQQQDGRKCAYLKVSCWWERIAEKLMMLFPCHVGCTEYHWTTWVVCSNLLDWVSVSGVGSQLRSMVVM